MNVKFYTIPIMVQKQSFRPPIPIFEAMSDICVNFPEYLTELLQGLLEYFPSIGLLFKSQVASHFIRNCLVSQDKSIEEKTTLVFVDLDVVSEYHQCLETS